MKTSVFDSLRNKLHELSKYAAATGGGLIAVSNDNYKLPTLNKHARIRLDNMANFEQDLFNDVDLMRFVKINLKISSINPVSIGIDIASQMFYFLDMINDIRGNIEVEPYIKFFEEAADGMVSYVKKLALPKILHGKDEHKGFASFTLFTEVDDMIWPDSLRVGVSRHTINDLPYYLSADLINRYSVSAFLDTKGNFLEINY